MYASLAVKPTFVVIMTHKHELVCTNLLNVYSYDLLFSSLITIIPVHVNAIMLVLYVFRKGSIESNRCSDEL